MTRQKLFFILIGISSLLFAMASVWFAFSRGVYLALGPVFGIPVVIFFISKPRLLLMACLMLFLSGIRFPGVFGNFNLYHFMAMLLIGMGVMGLFMRQPRPRLHTPSLVILALFSLNLLVLIFFRGTGFRFLGDTNWGGMRYVYLLISILFFLNATFVQLSEREWKITVGVMCLMGTLPFLAEGLFAVSRGAFYWHYYFFEFSGGTALHFESIIGEGEGVGRFQTARGAGESLILLALAFSYSPQMKRVFLISLFLVGFFLITLSGHRIGIIRASGMIWIYFFIRRYGHRFQYVGYTFVAGVALLIMIYILAPILPLTAQRAFSFLPGLNIDVVAELSSSNTSQWRLNLWRQALIEIPEYWILGKGYTFPANILEFLKLSGNAEYVEFWAIETSAYHNGILSLLIGMGVSGLILGSSFLGVLFLRELKVALASWKSTSLHSLFVAIFAVNAVTIVLFFTVYGDVQVTFPRVLFLGAVLEGLAWKLRKNETYAPIPSPESFDSDSKTVEV